MLISLTCLNLFAHKHSAPPPSITGLEESGVLANTSRKRSRDEGTQTDEDYYTKRLKLSTVSGINNDLLTEKGQMLITEYFPTSREQWAVSSVIKSPHSVN